MQRTDPDGYPYFQYLEDCNEFGDGGVTAWLFYPGMTYRKPGKVVAGHRLTGPQPMRDWISAILRIGSGRDLQFDPGVKIPVMTAGTVIAVCDDFLGRSVFLAASFRDKLISVYAHIVPFSNYSSRI